ncbi:stressosome-associated protein Prli42 [Sporosarcina aquimarina]|uniref:Stressosome-associated protein Prli42 n=1 Tax=Sporosarcina aquimarina TaxID=114975 RepID=A0ABU4G2X0_9BACL|nr:stressosome-associated protein Prli42 [Sporosarcina aquimarina]MDW0111315.1 stressosome-associated protein Prli42 [Sporosarcina aquimarina]
MSNKKVQKTIVYIMIATMIASTIVIGLSTLF